MVKEGDNATIQVVTNGESTQGLYNCADITFSSSAPPAQECTNGTGVRTTQYTGQSANANGTDSTEASETTDPASETAMASPSGEAGTSAGAAVTLELGGFAMLAACLLQALAL
ncbi:MAG: hypothetical protein Q9174_003392 [Haloplaca sp. 1 TL-2023]